VVIGETAFIKGDVICENIDLWGKMEGNLYVKDTLSLMEGCSIDGNLHVRRLSVELGSTFNGNCRMITEAEFNKIAGVDTQKAESAKPAQK
jgi:cytoskeletal protein CcmA (bactofilin family)